METYKFKHKTLKKKRKNKQKGTKLESLSESVHE